MKPKPPFDQIQTCAEGAQERIKALNIKGKKRASDEAFAYVVGFSTALDKCGYDITPLVLWISHDLSYDATRAIKSALEKENNNV